MDVEVAVIGAGAWGKNLVRNLHKLGALSTVCDADPSVFEPLREKYKGVEFLENAEDVFENKRIKAVFIATPPATHYALAKEALSCGKDVFVEKPLALSVEEGRELVKIADKESLILMVGHILHYHPAVVRLKELIEEGELGKIQYIYSNRLNIGRIRTEENIFWSFAPHDISLILSITTQIPESICAHGARYLQTGVEDVTLTYMRFPNGINAHIFVSWLNPFKEQKFVVIGDRKMAVFDDVSEHRYKLRLYPHQIRWKKGIIPVAEKADFELVQFPEKEPLEEECRHFLHCIIERKQPLTNGEEALRVLEVLVVSVKKLLEKAYDPYSIL